MMMSYLPTDLVEEILCRVPATTLSRLRYTCKLWNALFKDKIFTKKHLDSAKKEVFLLMLDEQKISPLNVNLHEHNNTFTFSLSEEFFLVNTLSKEFKSELSLKESNSSSSKVDVLQAFHCDGLLVCTTKDDRLVVWNPCTGESKWIKHSNNHYKHSLFTLGYEEGKTCRNYKILRYRNIIYTNHRAVVFKIYDFRSSSWRSLKITANFFFRTHGLSLKGNTYWLTNENHLLCFDFSRERLERLNLPFREKYMGNVDLSIVREEKLSVFYQRFGTTKMKIWVTSIGKIDQTISLSWRVFLAIDISVLGSWTQLKSVVSFFIDEEKKVALYCEHTHLKRTVKTKLSILGEYGEIPFGEPIHKPRHVFTFSYAPSLVQIQQGTKIPRSGKRKRTKVID